MRKSDAAIFLSVLFTLSACGSAPAAPSPEASSPRSDAAATAPTPAGTSSGVFASVSPTASPSQAGTSLASGVRLPACTPGTPEASATVAFVAAGYAWSLDPYDDELTCLFPVADAGPFDWGPRGDRVLLGGLEVAGVAGGPSLAATDRAYAAITWSLPTGKAIVVAPGPGTSLEKVHVNGAPTQDVTPLPSTTYLNVAYHPSGEAFAFVADQGVGESILISSNTGKTPGRLVFTEEGTTFGAIGFDVDGRHLLYAAQHADNHGELHRIDITDPSKAPVVWSGPPGPTILDIQPGFVTGTVAWTTGTSCADSSAMIQSAAGTRRAVPDADRSTRAVGWLSTTALLVATGGCDEPLDLGTVDVASGRRPAGDGRGCRGREDTRSDTSGPAAGRRCDPRQRLQLISR